MEQGTIIETERRERLSAFLSILIYIIIFIFLSAVFSFAAILLSGVSQLSRFTMPDYIVMQTGTLMAAVIPTYIMLKYVDKYPISNFGFNIKGRIKDILYGMLFAILLYGIGFGVSLALGIIEIKSVHLDIAALLGSFIFFILVSFTEEIMFRGYILGRLLRTRLNRFLALFISSVLFALLHIMNPNIAFLPMLNLLLAGCLLGASFIYTRNLWFPLSLHLFWNWIQGPVLGYEVSGNVLGPSLIKLHLPERNLLNGGSFGFEGSIICTALIVLLTIGIICYFERRRAG